jgi:hypothetical protein
LTRHQDSDLAETSHLADLIADAIGNRSRLGPTGLDEPPGALLIRAREEFDAAGFAGVPEGAIVLRARELAVEQAQERPT